MEEVLHFDTKVVRSTLRGIEKGFDIIAQQGGTYSGKTFGIILALMLLMRSADRTYKIRVVGQSVPHLKDGALADFHTILNLAHFDYQSNETDKVYGIGKSTIKFLSIDKLGKAKGGKFDITFINECNEIPYEIATQLMLRTNLAVILDWNPTNEFWFHEKIFPNKAKKILFKRTTYKDNPAISEKKIRDIEALKDEDDQLYRVYGLGLTGNIRGLVFVNTAIVQDFPEGCKKIAFGLDFGFTNDPTALVVVGEKGGELFIKELIYETGLTNDDICEHFKEWEIDKTDEIFADAAEPKSIEEIRRKGYNIKAAKKGADSVNFGIGQLKKYRLNITADSPNLRKEAKNYKWKEKDGKSLNIPIDAFNHCFTGDTLVMTLNGEKPISTVVEGDLVLTSKGFRKVLKKWENGVKKVEQYRITSNGECVSLTCTDNHLIKTLRGWIQIKDLQKTDSIYLCNHSVAKTIISMRARDIFQRGLSAFMSLSGNLQTGKFPKAFRFTIKTKTPKTTLLKILNCVKSMNTKVFTQKRGLPKIQAMPNCFNQEGKRRQKNGTKAMKAGRGTENMPKRIVSVGSHLATKVVAYVKKYSLQKQQGRSFALTVARQKTGTHRALTIFKDRVLSVARLSRLINIQGKPLAQLAALESLSVTNEHWQEVYDLTVEGEHEYFANGVLVHNCLDALRYYAVMKLPVPSNTKIRIISQR